MQHPSVAASRGLAIVSFIFAAAHVEIAAADTVTDWNEYSVEATKGFNGVTASGVALDTNLASRIDAIEARAVFDAVNSIQHFSGGSYYYAGSHTGSAAAAAAQAAHDVLIALLPNPAADAAVDARWLQPRAWVDSQLVDTLDSLGITASDAGVEAGKAASAAALAARRIDGASPVVTYGAELTPTSNPGIGVWRQSNAAPVFVNPVTGAPTGFDETGTLVQPRPGIDLNWRDVAPFSLTARQKAALVASVPLSPAVGSREYQLELEYVREHGQDTAPLNVRSADQTAQALYYKQDAEIFIDEAARVASEARGLTLEENAALFALLSNAVADVRFAVFDSKYEQKFWRPITALNADPDGAVTNGYAAWHPVAATPAHPSNTSGHSATVAAGAEILRAFFGSDRIRPDGAQVALGSLPWFVGANGGTGNSTSRDVSTFSQVQLENGASRLYLGVHYGADNVQGQLLGLAVADTILCSSRDPAAAGLTLQDSRVSAAHLEDTLLEHTELYGFYGWDGLAR